MPGLAPRETLRRHHKPIFELATIDMVKLDGSLFSPGSVVLVHRVQLLITLSERKERFCGMGAYTQMMVETLPVLANLATQTGRSRLCMPVLSCSADPLLAVLLQLELSICASSLKQANVFVLVEVAVLMIRQVRKALLPLHTFPEGPAYSPYSGWERAGAEHPLRGSGRLAKR